MNLGLYLIWFNFRSIKYFDLRLFYIDNLSRGFIGIGIDIENHLMREFIKKSIEVDILYFRFKKELK